MSAFPSELVHDVIWAPKGLMTKLAPDAVCVISIGSFDMRTKWISNQAAYLK